MMHPYTMPLSRRSFALGLTAGVGALALSSCSGASPQTPAEPPATDALSYSRTHFAEDIHLLVANDPAGEEYDAGIAAWRALDYPTAEEHLRAAQEAAAAKYGTGSVQAACVDNSLGCLLLDMAQYEEGYDCLNSAYVTMKDAYGSDSVPAQIVLTATTSYDFLTGDYDTCLKDVTSLAESPSDFSIYAAANRIKSKLLYARGQYTESIKTALEDIFACLYVKDKEATWDNALELNEYLQSLGEDHPFSPNNLLMIALLSYEVAEGYRAVVASPDAYNRAQKYYQAVHHICEDLIDGEDATVVLCAARRGEGFLQTNAMAIDADGALVTRDESEVLDGASFLAILEDIRAKEGPLFGHDVDGYPGLVDVDLATADVYGYLLDDKENALDWYDRALTRAEAAYGHNHPSTAEVLYRTANYHGNRLREDEKAIELVTEAIEIRKNILAEFTAKTSQYYTFLAGGYRLMGDEESSEKYLARAQEINEALGIWLLTTEKLEDAAEIADAKEQDGAAEGEESSDG